MLFGRAGRDDADDFFATIILPIHVNNQQNGSSAGFYLNCANRMPALFFRLALDAVRVDDATFVLEHSAASSNEIPSCFRRFRRFFASSHS